jgi:hypothetical protein
MGVGITTLRVMTHKDTTANRVKLGLSMNELLLLRGEIYNSPTIVLRFDK